MDSFWTWLGSGWGDAWAQWQHPLTSIENSLASTAGLPTTPVAGSTTWSAGNSTGDAAPDTSDDGSNAEPWVIAGGLLVALLLIVVLLHELEML